jgi:hypothetical protein
MWQDDPARVHSATQAGQDVEQKRRRRRERLVRLVVVLVAAAFVFGFPIYAQHVYEQPFYRAYRAKAIGVMEAEIARLEPPYDDASSLGMDVTNTSDAPPSVIAFYSLVAGQCPNANTYYATRAPQEGWAVAQPITSHRNLYNGVVTTFSTYRETVQDLNLELDVDCDDIASYGYDLGIFIDNSNVIG